MTYLFIFITHLFIILLVPHNCFSVFKYCTFLIVLYCILCIHMDYLSEIDILQWRTCHWRWPRDFVGSHKSALRIDVIIGWRQTTVPMSQQVSPVTTTSLEAPEMPSETHSEMTRHHRRTSAERELCTALSTFLAKGKDCPRSGA